MLHFWLGASCFLLALVFACDQGALANEDAKFQSSPEKSLPDSSSVFKPLSEDNLNFFCLQKSYPEIIGAEAAPSGEVWLRLVNGKKVLYRQGQALETTSVKKDAFDVDVAGSMADPYPLEPERPATPLGLAPGRKRSYALLQAIYGENAQEVKKGLRKTKFLGQGIELSAQSATALGRAQSALENGLQINPELRRWLKVDGGFVLRKIAGEKRLSPHAFGIALDLSAHIAPYWRWSKKMPHPLQKSYPGEIVKAFENAGFIWGGKWHEYDLMHFEYRPELICKARLRQQFTASPALLSKSKD